YNGARAFQAARQIGKAIALREILVDPQYGTGELAKVALYEIGAMHQAIASYVEAADHYERFATAYPEDDKAPTALGDVVVLRLGLGQADAAAASAKRFRESYGGKLPQRAAQVAFAVVADQVE